MHSELSSVALSGSIVKVSDEFFAEASNLLKVEVNYASMTFRNTL